MKKISYCTNLRKEWQEQDGQRRDCEGRAPRLAWGRSWADCPSPAGSSKHTSRQQKLSPYFRPAAAKVLSTYFFRRWFHSCNGRDFKEGLCYTWDGAEGAGEWLDVQCIGGGVDGCWGRGGRWSQRTQGVVAAESSRVSLFSNSCQHRRHTTSCSSLLFLSEPWEETYRIFNASQDCEP